MNPRQLDVLKWISEGCPPGRWPPDDYSHTLSARALSHRGLVVVKGRGPRWSATITDDGRYYLTHGAYPAGHRLEPPRDRRRRENSEAAARIPTPEPKPKPIPTEFEIDSPRALRERERKKYPNKPQPEPHPWDDRVLISVKEAAWVLGLSTSMVYDAVRAGDVDRVYIGEGTTHYRIVYASLLAWVNSLPREPVRRW